MQMLCKVSSVFSDVDCPTCGQGFMVYWTRQRAGGREQQLQTMQSLLREQHDATGSTDAHAPAFQLPDAPAAVPRRERRFISAGVPLYS